MNEIKIKGKKRHILVDTLGILLHAIFHPADIQDCDGGILRSFDAVRPIVAEKDILCRRLL